MLACVGATMSLACAAEAPPRPAVTTSLTAKPSPATKPAPAPQYVDEIASPLKPAPTMFVISNTIVMLPDLTLEQLSEEWRANGGVQRNYVEASTRARLSIECVAAGGRTTASIASTMPPERHAALVEAARAALVIQAPPAPPTAQTAEAAATAPVEKDARRSDTFETPLEPLGATAAIKDAFASTLRFTLRNFQLDPVSGEPDGDLFSSGFTARTFSGQQIDVRAHWIDDGRTTVTVRSDLPMAQHERLLAEVRRALVPKPG